ncbi:ATP-dependent Clp protease adaptor ClpS [Dyadobacter diqingensis]|jgi:ATP-dependent Clp protease adaptor protein ClpS|uniref:ATP-dependent Clp protease adaptor ClpS n=1 Tax=Dyadobacter diqingensis TaxID=2938121 RepID=UPI0020C4F77E|nr:ATP-dependent Clp protease adaptor ClpS [Dyadobacter diqingensis]
MQVLIDTETEILEKTVETELKKLVVYNDDVNTFDWVIDTLVDVCKHTSEQAEQCTIIIHYKGKCSVKEGEFDELVGMRNEICRRGISAEIH